ncbi:MAG: competence/damage-inducible protein A [Defluviitaleaceae bacterium]|nr:competence/damage-inducible protein A [Defluviitaleaceae bacterium]
MTRASEPRSASDKTAEILTVGTEILLGNIVNSNAAFLSRELAALGVSVFRHTSVGDNPERLASAFARAFEHADIVITTGGLGPTQDDITKHVAAKFFGLETEIHEESQRRIEARFAGRDLPENVERNAIVPVGARIFQNDNGAAPGICIEAAKTSENPFSRRLWRDFCAKNPGAIFQHSFRGKILIMLPGPPHEMQPMFKTYVANFLREKSDSVFISRTLKIIGKGETAVESDLRDLIDAQTNPTIAPYAKVGEVHVRVTARVRQAHNELRGHMPEAIHSLEAGRDSQNSRPSPVLNNPSPLLSPVCDEIYTRLGAHIYAEDDVTLAEVIVDALKKNNLTLALAESCTGGMVAAKIVDVPGCSDVFREGFVTYSNEAKIARLGVCENLLREHGAVSEEVAGAMAEGAANAAGTDVGLSVTGIAGPDGGTPEKPVGLVYIGLHMKGRGTQIERHNLTGNRGVIRERTAILTLDFLRRVL